MSKLFLVFGKIKELWVETKDRILPLSHTILIIIASKSFYWNNLFLFRRVQLRLTFWAVWSPVTIKTLTPPLVVTETMSVTVTLTIGSHEICQGEVHWYIFNLESTINNFPTYCCSTVIWIENKMGLKASRHARETKKISTVHCLFCNKILSIELLPYDVETFLV